MVKKKNMNYNRWDSKEKRNRHSW